MAENGRKKVIQIIRCEKLHTQFKCWFSDGFRFIKPQMGLKSINLWAFFLSLSRFLFCVLSWVKYFTKRIFVCVTLLIPNVNKLWQKLNARKCASTCPNCFVRPVFLYEVFFFLNCHARINTSIYIVCLVIVLVGTQWGQLILWEPFNFYAHTHLKWMRITLLWALPIKIHWTKRIWFVTDLFCTWCFHHKWKNKNSTIFTKTGFLGQSNSRPNDL